MKDGKDGNQIKQVVFKKLHAHKCSKQERQLQN